MSSIDDSSTSVVTVFNPFVSYSSKTAAAWSIENPLFISDCSTLSLSDEKLGN